LLKKAGEGVVCARLPRLMPSEKRILVVDDDDAIRALLFTIFRRRGYKVDTARNGAEALQRCMACRYALVVLDLMMPMMSGYDFVDHVAAQSSMDRPLVLVLTAGNEPRNLDPSVVAGTMRKPFDIELLLDTVKACLSTAGDREQMDDCPQPQSDSRTVTHRTPPSAKPN
jgi:DNA-binding response OmpR family regulator